MAGPPPAQAVALDHIEVDIGYATVDDGWPEGLVRVHGRSAGSKPSSSVVGSNDS